MRGGGRDADAAEEAAPLRELVVIDIADGRAALMDASSGETIEGVPLPGGAEGQRMRELFAEPDELVVAVDGARIVRCL